MTRPPRSVDLSSYLLGVPRLLTHPSVLIAPILGTIAAFILDYLGNLISDPLGNLGSQIYVELGDVALLCGFGIAIIQASHIWRGRRGSFGDAWQEGRAKIGGILYASIAIVFVSMLGGWLGGIFGPYITWAIELVITFFLIYTIAAAAIGGLPGGAAVSGSIRGAKANRLAAGVLTVVTIALWWLQANILFLLAPWITGFVSPLGFELLHALIEAIFLAYLAFPFAKQYDDIAFRAFW